MRRQIFKSAIFKYILLVAAAAVLVIVAVILLRSCGVIGNNGATPEKALKAAGIGSITKTFTYGDMSASVAQSGGTVYFCRSQNGKWKYAASKSANSGDTLPKPVMFYDDGKGTNALCAVFGSSPKAAGMSLISSAGGSKKADDGVKAGDRYIGVFKLSAAGSDTASYTVQEYDADNLALNATDYNFADGSFDILCNGTAYHYPVSGNGDIADAFTARFNGAALDFSAFKAKPASDYTFVVTYRSLTHAIIRPAQIKNPVTNESVSIIMPLDGADSAYIFADGAAHPLKAHQTPDKLYTVVMAKISGKEQ